jgi:outer membrane protein OmpA-like peptidoglycan-associated protein
MGLASVVWGISLVLVLLLLTGGCATPDMITLVRSLQDSPAQVSVESVSETRTLTAPLETASLRGTGMQVRTSTPAEVREVFGRVLDATPPQSRLYTISFATGASAIPLEADSTVMALLEDVSTQQVVEVEITGHTDRVGTVEANDRLSKERAVAVREALIARGLRATLVRVVGRGEREPLVPTADEVAESSNRRVVIVVR